MLKLRKGLTEELCRDEEIWTLTFGEMLIKVREQEVNVLEIVACNNVTLNLFGMAKVISRLLKGSFKDCNYVVIGNTKFEKNLEEEDIKKILLKAKDIIELSTGWKLEVSEASSF